MKDQFEKTVVAEMRLHESVLGWHVGAYTNQYTQCLFKGFCIAWQHRQGEVDDLQKRLDELTVGCGLQRDHIKELETELKKAWTAVDQEAHKNHELVMLLKFIKEHFEMNDLDKVMPRVYEKLEQALKGGCDE